MSQTFEDTRRWSVLAPRPRIEWIAIAASILCVALRITGLFLDRSSTLYEAVDMSQSVAILVVIGCFLKAVETARRNRNTPAF